MKKLVLTLVLLVMALGLTSTAIAGRQDVTFINNSGYRVDYLYCSPSSHNNWGDDWLGNQYLYDGQSFFMQFPDWENNCQWDFMVIDEDGDRWETRGVNLCRVYRVILYFSNGRLVFRTE